MMNIDRSENKISNDPSMVVCSWCGYDEVKSDADVGYGSASKLYWCEACGRYNYIDKNKTVCDNFKLVLESKAKTNPTDYFQPFKLKKQISLYRYPGGKSGLIDYLATLLDPKKMATFVSAFAGATHMGLSLLEAGVIGHLVINDLEYGVFSLFNVIKERPDKLMKLIIEKTPTRDEFFKCQEQMVNEYEGLSEVESAWAFLVVNRLGRNGIYDSNPMSDMLCRWNSKTLLKRILMIHKMSNKITVLCCDALEVIEEYYWRSNTTIFLDPPYYKKGKVLYKHYYTEEDHLNLRDLIGSLVHDFPCADVIMTYDDCEEVRRMYSHPLNWYAEIIPIGRVYSIVN